MAAPQSVATARSGTLAQSIAQGDTPTTLLIDIRENWSITSGVVRVGVGDSREWFSFTGLTVVTANERIQLTGVTRALKKNASSLTDNDTATYAKSHAIGSKVILVHHSAQINKLVQEDADQTLSGDNTLTGTNTFSSTSQATLISQNVTEAQRDAATGAANGAILYNTDNGTIDGYIAGTWQHLSTGSADNATETTPGVVELATVAEQGSAAATGGSGAPTVVQTQYLISTSSGSGDENKIAILDSSGKFDSTFMPESVTKFGGDGSDGDISGALTITGSNGTYIIKQYDSFIPGNNTVTVTPTNCIVHIKVKGDADLTNTTFDFAGKGGPGGSGGAGVVGTSTNNGSTGTSSFRTFFSTTGGNGGEGSDTANTDGGDGGVSDYTLTTDISALVLGSRSIPIAPGSGGGGGGGGGGGSPQSGGDGGDGGNGGGCLILEVAGDLTVGGTTIDCSGEDGSNGTDGDTGVNTAFGGGGGGGGGGGSCVILYGGTLSGTVSPNTSSGNAGTGGTTETSGGGSRHGATGGGGGASIWVNGTDATDVVNQLGDGGAGGDGGTGYSLLAQNTVFQ